METNSLFVGKEHFPPVDLGKLPSLVKPGIDAETLRAEPAIDIQDCTGHVRGGVPRQEGEPGGNLLWSFKAVQCNAFDQTAQLCLERFNQIRIRESREHDIE